MHSCWSTGYGPSFVAKDTAKKAPFYATTCILCQSIFIANKNNREDKKNALL